MALGTAIGLADYIKIVKKEARYGDPTSASDAAGTDVLNEINIRRKRIWARADWPWALEEIQFSTVVAQAGYDVLAKSANILDRIILLVPQDSTSTPATLGAPLVQMSLKDYYNWLVSNPASSATPVRYAVTGKSSAGKWQILVHPTPSIVFKMSGWGKKFLTTLAASDVTANTALDYFPDGVIEDVLLDGVLSGIYRIQGNDTEAARLDVQFESKLDRLVREQMLASVDDSGIASPPDISRRRIGNNVGEK